MSVVHRLRDSANALVDRLHPPRTVWAHCDIPCGIYDPHEAQIAALTVLRMDQLIGELPEPGAAAKPEETEAYGAKLARYMAVKEIHAERVKSELRVIWGDYFTPDHAKQFPTLHESFFQAMKLASRARQGTNPADAQALVAAVQGIAEMFWKSKGAATRKVPSLQKSGGEIVYPVPAA
jgi:nickel superoxide dismutase